MIKLLLLLMVLEGCVHKPDIDQNIEITVFYAQSFKCDLATQTYTVYFFSKPPLDIKFTFSENEKDSIAKKYYSLRLYKLKDSVLFKDHCWDMPKLYTTVQIKSKTRRQVFVIDQSCTSTYRFDGLKVKDFLKLINRIINSKPEIKNAPKTDIFYI